MDTYSTLGAAQAVAGNSYVGRGIIIGSTADGSKAAAAYFITGRSKNSRNRIFVKKDGELRTEPFDLSKVEDPALIIYSAVRSVKNTLIVTNGDQTDTVYDFIKAGRSFEDALRTREFEPDAPNFTPRISGAVSFGHGGFSYKLSILKSADARGTACVRQFFEYPAVAGLGHFIHTYEHDGDPVPSFRGEPVRINIPDDIDELTGELWSALDADNKIALYVRYTDADGSRYTDRLINKLTENI